jgi:catechol-2,3-dioxygenase
MNHIHLGAKNLENTKHFYEKYFGFRKKFDHGEGVFLVNNEGFLLAIDPVKELPKLPEWYHLGFCLKSEKEVLELYAAMKDHREEIVRDLVVSQGEFASFYVKDPDSNKLEVCWDIEN